MYSIQFLPHTADIRMSVIADSLEELFKGAFEGVRSLIKPKSTKAYDYKSSEQIDIEAMDTSSLLVDFLNRVISLSHINKIVYTDLEILSLETKKISALIQGNPMEDWEEDIKAVTYHEATVQRNENQQWKSKLIFDI